MIQHKNHTKRHVFFFLMSFVNLNQQWDYKKVNQPIQNF
jgi:hypothetical protein